MEQRRFTLGLDQRLGIHGPALLRLAKGFEGQACEENLLVGAGVEFLGHLGALRKAARRSVNLHHCRPEKHRGASPLPQGSINPVGAGLPRDQINKN
ncbi:hypothetical protein D3C76_1342790 [compost metagenome]